MDTISAVNVVINLMGGIFVLFLLALLRFSFHHGDKMHQFFRGFLWSYFIVLICYASFNSPIEYHYPILARIAWLANAFATGFSFFFFSLYTFAFLEKKRCKTSHTLVVLAAIPCAIDTLLTIYFDFFLTNEAGPWDDQLTQISWVPAIAWSILMIIHTARYHRYIGKRAYIAFNFYFVIPLIFGFISPMISAWQIDMLSFLPIFGGIFIGVQLQENSMRRMFERLSIQDTMTGLYNRNYLLMYPDKLERALPCSYVMFDLNRLKTINDQQGHHAGDEYIRTFVRLLKQSMPKNSELIRFGGDEFIAILPECGEEKCTELLSQFQQSMADSRAKGINTDASFGFAVRTTGRETEDQVIAKADNAMYMQKRENHRIADAKLASPKIPAQ